jgi:hypothetical protein
VFPMVEDAWNVGAGEPSMTIKEVGFVLCSEPFTDDQQHEWDAYRDPDGLYVTGPRRYTQAYRNRNGAGINWQASTAGYRQSINDVLRMMDQYTAPRPQPATMNILGHEYVYYAQADQWRPTDPASGYPTYSGEYIREYRVAQEMGRPFPLPTPVRMSLHTQDPRTNPDAEVSGGGYARQTFTPPVARAGARADYVWIDEVINDNLPDAFARAAERRARFPSGTVNFANGTVTFTVD